MGLPASITIRTRQSDESLGSTKIPGLSAIFSQTTLMENNTTKMVTIEALQPFREHPFRMDKAKIAELGASIKENGILMPLIVRELEAGSYEILAGHRRCEAAKLAGLDEVPAMVLKNLSDEQAVIIMTETNLKQREHLLYSEKAKAYKLQLDAIKSQGKRLDLLGFGDLEGAENEGFEGENQGENSGDLTSVPLGQKYDSRDMVAENNNESRTNIFRYIRLNYLHTPLLDLVDENIVPFRAGVDLSYLKPEEQQNFHTLLTQKEGAKLTLEMAALLKALSKEGTLTIAKMEDLLGYNQQAKAQTVAYNPYLNAGKKLNKLLKTYAKNSTTQADEGLEAAIIQAVEAAIKSYNTEAK